MPSISLPKNRIRSIADQVCDRLRSELLVGIHVAGTPMREEELAKRMGVSRHPIRKAIQKLTEEGLLSAKPNCGAVVAQTPAEHVEGLLTPLRQQLEMYALRLAFPKFDDALRADFEAIVEEMHRGGNDQDLRKSLDCDALFHRQILVAAGLDEMIPLWQGIFGRMRDFHQARNAQLTDLRLIAFLHALLLDSFFSGDIERACHDLATHIDGTDFNQRAMRAWNREYKAFGIEGTLP